MKRSLLFSLLMMTTTISLFSATEHRDGCKEFADACTCSNTGSKGFCLTGWMSNPEDQLYCDCSSNVYSEDEMISFMIKRFCQKEPDNVALKFREIIRTSSKSRRSAIILDEMLKLLGDNPTDFDISGKNTAKLRKNTQNFLKLREDLKKATRLEKVMPMFFFTDGTCYYINQECVCANTGRKGVCSASHTPGGEPPQITCHCE